MAGSAQLTRGSGAVVVLAAAAVLGVGLAGAGSGLLNGDAAVYLAQAHQADLGQRTVHLGWIGLASLLATVAGDQLSWWLDGITAAAAAGAVVAVGCLGRRGSPGVAAVVFAAVAVPRASFAEVDLPWIALVLGAAAVRSPRVAAGMVLVAVSLSPVALLAVPWVAATRGRQGAGWLLLGAAVSVALLSALSAGDWWWGDRGVLHSGAPRPWRVAQAWVAGMGLPVILLGAVGWRAVGWRGLLLAPMVVAPADVPTWILGGAVAGIGGARAWALVGHRARIGMVAVLLGVVGLGVMRWSALRAQVRTEDRVIRAVVDGMGPEDGLVATWTWGARASVVAVGDPYALPWRTPGAPVRDQAARWCGRTFHRVAVLPPGERLPGAGEVVDGVWWASEGWTDLEGCR